MEHKSNQRKFRLDNVETEIIGMVPGIIREYSVHQKREEYSDRTFWGLLCGCNKHCGCEDYCSTDCEYHVNQSSKGAGGGHP